MAGHLLKKWHSLVVLGFWGGRPRIPGGGLKSASDGTFAEILANLLF